MKLTFTCTICAVLYSSLLLAQAVGINNTTPHTSSILDVKSNIKGVLLPRTSTLSRVAITNPAKGLLLYDSTVSAFYFYNGTVWAPISAGSTGWKLTGNGGINASNNFIGTTDNKPLRFRVNNLWAGEIHPSSGNSFFGLGAGQANTTAVNNTANGHQSLFSNTSGSLNTALGFESLYSNTTGSFNTASGYQALYSNTSGLHNTANGISALYSNTIGSENTANGWNALNSNTTGSNNIATGNNSLAYNITGDNNSAYGYQALFLNDIGINNTAIGVFALLSNTIGSYNTAIGEMSLYSNGDGDFNTAIGNRTLYSSISRDYNTAIGNDALYNLVGGSYNIAVGGLSGTAIGSPNVNNTISIGNIDILNGASNQVILGNFSSTGYYSNNPWATFSDARIKKNINDDVKGLDFIMRLKPVTYYKSIKEMVRLTGNKEIADYPGKYDVEKVKFSGFLAQDVELAAKETGYEFSGLHKPNNNNDLYALSYETFVVPLVKAVQEQQITIMALSLEEKQHSVTRYNKDQQVIIENLQKQIAMLEKRLAALETTK